MWHPNDLNIKHCKHIIEFSDKMEVKGNETSKSRSAAPNLIKIPTKCDQFDATFAHQILKNWFTKNDIDPGKVKIR